MDAAIKNDESLKDDELLKFFRALSHPVRLKIIQVLLTKRFCICRQLVILFPQSQATVSQHLKVLRMAGLIRWQGVSNAVAYQINRQAVKCFRELVNELTITDETTYF
jgi:ArsR family transcriptional regulator